jgi:hypothetical protein
LNVLALTLLLAIAVKAQQVNATLVGTVMDPRGAVVQNAKVAVTEAQTNVSRTTSTNESGNYTVPNLPPGTYFVTVEVQGFKKETRRDIIVQVDTTTRGDLRLTPGSLSETVEVTGAPALLQTDTATTGVKMDTTLVADAPLISSNRNFQGLLNLVPGVAPVQEQHSQFFNAASSLQTEVNGQARQGNNFMIEGTDDNERTGLLQVYTYFPGLRAWEFFAFVGDRWQVSPKLTVDLGLRWEFYPPATPPFPGLFSNYDPNNNTLVVAGTGGNPQNLGMTTRYKYFAPRVGLAYRLSENQWSAVASASATRHSRTTLTLTTIPNARIISTPTSGMVMQPPCCRTGSRRRSSKAFRRQRLSQFRPMESFRRVVHC